MGVVIVTAVVTTGGCGRKSAPPAPSTPTATAAQPSGQRRLTPHDVEIYLAVRDRALQRLEDSLAAVERKGNADIGTIEELSVAEQKAAHSLGIDWRTYEEVRDEIARLMSSQRHREDAQVLNLELRHAREDLVAQLALARDPASKQFLEAQLSTLNAQIEKLDREQAQTPVESDQTKLLDSVRAEIAVQQGRQERISKRVKELLDRARAVATSGPLPVSPARTTAPQPTPTAH